MENSISGTTMMPAALATVGGEASPGRHDMIGVGGMTMRHRWQTHQTNERPGLLRGAPWSVRALLAALAMLLVPGSARAQVVQYYHLDAVGNVRVVTDQSGQVVKDSQGQEVGRHEFLPFGEEYNGPVPPPETRLFTGKERDFETGFDCSGARYGEASAAGAL
jgi:hypothetical protein